VDDEPENLYVFEATFGGAYEVLTATDGKAALAILEETPAPVVISDQRMPGMSGVEFLTRVRELYPDSMRIILTAFTDVSDIIDAINLGHIYKFVTKPWEPHDLGLTLRHVFEAHDLARENRSLTSELLRQERLATVGQLVSGLAHEIQNQLNVRGFADAILARYPDDAYLRDRVTMIKNALIVISGMVREIKDFSRQAPVSETPAVEHDLSRIARDVLSLLEFDADVSRVCVTAALTERVVVRCRPDKLQQVVINLVRNAAQATLDRPDPEVRVEIETDAGMGVLRVSDNGCGIADRYVGRIWEPFFTTKAEGGMGLGLHICKSLVERDGGTIECRSRAGGGSTFEFRVPLGAAGRESETAPGAGGRAETEPV
jgi:signal transduction histidine kinase